jgi:hypothetical protein
MDSDDLSHIGTSTLREKIKSYIPSFFIFNIVLTLWSSGQSSWLQIQRSRVRFPALIDFLIGIGSGTGSTQPHEYN